MTTRSRSLSIYAATRVLLVEQAFAQARANLPIDCPLRARNLDVPSSSLSIREREMRREYLTARVEDGLVAHDHLVVLENLVLEEARLESVSTD